MGTIMCWSSLWDPLFWKLPYHDNTVVNHNKQNAHTSDLFMGAKSPYHGYVPDLAGELHNVRALSALAAGSSHNLYWVAVEELIKLP